MHLTTASYEAANLAPCAAPFLVQGARTGIPFSLGAPSMLPKSENVKVDTLSRKLNYKKISHKLKI